MRVLSLRLVSCRNFVKYNPCIRFNSISAVSQLSSDLSDAGCDEQTQYTKNTTLDDKVLDFDSSKVTLHLNNLRKSPSLALSCFHQLKECGFQHDVCTYMAIIRILCYWGMDIKLHYVLLDVIEPEIEHLGFEVSDLCDALLEGLKAEGPNSLVCVMSILGGLMKPLIFFLKTERHGFLPNILTCNFLMNRLIEFGKVDMTVAIYL